MKKVMKILGLILVLILVLGAIGSCGSSKSEYVGTYVCNSGYQIDLRSDGTATYADSLSSGQGTWDVKDDVIYIDVTIGGFLTLNLYGDVSNFDGTVTLQDANGLVNAKEFIRTN